MIKIEKSNQCSRYLVLAADAVLLGLLAFFAWTTVYSSDDYWYSTFWDGGVQDYLNLMEYHYREFNGRTLVHMFVHVVLHFENWAFVLACCGLCLTAIIAACRVAHVQKERMAATVAIYLAGILAMPTSFFTEGMMWISAFFNYLFPVAFSCILMAALEMHWCKALLYTVAFLCGATTEQMGLTSVVICAVYVIDAAIRRKGVGHYLPSVGFAVAGVLTIFLSPATQNRVSKNLSMESLAQILNDILTSVSQEAELLTENPVPTILMLAFFLLAGVLLWRSNRKRGYICAAAIGSVALLVGSLAGGNLQIVGYVITFAVLLCLAAALVMHEERIPGVLMLAALASAAVMLPINSVAPRTMVPFYVLALLSVSVLAGKLDTNGYINGTAVWVIAAVTAVSLIPAIKGYWHNHQIDLLNQSFIEQDRHSTILRYCPDYDYDYTWIGKVHTNSAYQRFYLQTNDMPEDMKVFFFSGDYDPPRIFCGKEQLNDYAAITEPGGCYLPLRSIVEHYGGVVEWSPEAVLIRLNEMSYSLQSDGETGILRWTDAEGKLREQIYPCIRYYGVIYCAQELLANILELTVEFDRESNDILLISRTESGRSVTE